MKYKALIIIILLGIVGIVFLSNKSKLSQSPSLNSENQIPAPFSPKTSKGQVPNIPFKLNDGFVIHTFANGLVNPRDLQFTPGGTLLVSSPSNTQILALPDKDHDGQADQRKVVINIGNQVHGLAFYGGKLYVAEVNRVVRYNWNEENLSATQDKILFSLPNNSNHNKRTLVFDKDGKMYVSVGSTCNVCNENSNLSATVLVSDKDGKSPTVFAKGLRNAPFIQFNPKTQELWGTEMGRDYLGDTLPPDEIDIIRSGKNYGWPVCYGNKIHDTNFDDNKSNPCSLTEAPIFEIPAHSAPLGLTFINSSQFPENWQGDLLVSYHGSWNRSVPDGYKVVHLKVSGNSVLSAEDFLTGFLPDSSKSGSDALARPVDLTFDSSGNLYLSDDKSGNIFIIQKKDL